MKTNKCILEYFVNQYNEKFPTPRIAIIANTVFLFYNATSQVFAQAFTSRPPSANAFIDDTSFLAIGPSSRENCLNRQQELTKHVSNGSRPTALSKMPTPSPHATQKSSVCLRQLNQPFLRILKPSTTGRLLGVTLDTKLRLEKKDYIDAIARLGGATWKLWHIS